jgi:Oxidoreductase molybdopterin binding domain
MVRASQKMSWPQRVSEYLRRPLAPPPEKLRRGPFRDGAFVSSARSQRLSSQLGIALGTAFLVCFVTGLLSHEIQHPPGWFWWPSRPVWLYRVTQGTHVATGIALIPLLATKLWSVYPKLFTWPPARDLAHAIERSSIAVLVASALFQVVTGVLNIARWYTPMPFFFTAAHYFTAWLAMGSLLVHIGVQLPVVRASLSRNTRTPTTSIPPSTTPSAISRRGLLTTVSATAGLLTVATLGQTVPWLSDLSVLAPRRPKLGPQHLPVNKSAIGAGVVATARDPAYRLTIIGPAGVVSLSLADLAAMPQANSSLPIACVEGWSAEAHWSGVRLRDLVRMAGGDDHSQVLTESLENHGRYRSSVVAPPHAQDPLTLVALRLGGEPLDLDHGFPCRLIAPNRPGVMQTKWLAGLTVARP